MSFLDYIVFGLYLLGTLGLGAFFYFRNKTSKDMFSAGGEAPWWVSGLSGFMTLFSAATFVVWGGLAYKHGIVALSINMCYGIAALAAGYFIAGRWKALGVDTPSEYISLRFGDAAVQFYIWVMLAFRIVGSAVSLYGLAVLLVPLMPLSDGHILQSEETGFLSVEWAIFLLGLIVVFYTMAGGLWAVLMTDVVQFIILSLSVVFVVVLLLIDVGGINSVIERAPPQFFDLVNDEFTWYFLVAWCLINFVTVGGEWAFAQRFISVRNVGEAKKSAYLISALYLVSPVIWLAPTLIYRIVNPDANPEQAYILASITVLPVGMVGMMAAALFSATASMVSSQLNVFAGALTYQFYQARIKPAASEAELIWVGRFASVIIGALLIGIALLIPNFGGAAKVVISKAILIVVPLMLPAVWGLFSSSISSRSVWVVAGTSVFVGVVLKGLFLEGGLLAEVEYLVNFSHWVQNSQRLVDILIGVVLPIFVMSILQIRSKGVDEGWRRVEAIEPKIETRPIASIYDSTPAWIVVIALGVSAAIMIVIALLTEENRRELMVFVGVLLAIGLIVLRSNFKMNDAKQKLTRL
ncbi:sodium:solute symporter family transporter [Hirschia litorea]|uniref:Na+:solute symporter n=1 Tax=Hirschia litorea TaxID=1199156 RepID=A0ABW2INU7_9PROT